MKDKDAQFNYSTDEAIYAAAVGKAVNRKLRARKAGSVGLGFGLGMSGVIGWSVAMPTVLGAGVGWWLDQHHKSGRSWTLMLLVAGLCLGCANAWYWVTQQDRAMHPAVESEDE